jgi:hypothetical protein
MSQVPKTRDAKSDGVNIACQVLGGGPLDLVYVPGWLSNVEMMWENPMLARFMRRLASSPGSSGASRRSSAGASGISPGGRGVRHEHRA